MSPAPLALDPTDRWASRRDPGLRPTRDRCPRSARRGPQPQARQGREHEEPRVRSSREREHTLHRQGQGINPAQAAGPRQRGEDALSRFSQSGCIGPPSPGDPQVDRHQAARRARRRAPIRTSRRRRPPVPPSCGSPSVGAKRARTPSASKVRSQAHQMAEIPQDQQGPTRRRATNPSLSRAVHHTPSVTGKRQATEQEAREPQQPARFSASRAASRQVARRPSLAADSSSGARSRPGEAPAA